ncbi:FAD-binding oxidoreductase [Elioraea sp.]|uniref:NAD(P)/FAD-dependent oxidoreductase n=1 Tax=Elioraea sp. TaxID=2185103 RepID=UPI00307DD3BD
MISKDIMLGAPVWLATAPPPPATRPVAGPAETRVAVIGAGILGLSTALALARNGVETVVLEAAGIGAGASGASGGQVIPGLRFDPGELERVWGAAAGQRGWRFGMETADTAFALIRREGLDCHAEQRGWIQASDTDHGLAEARRRVDLCRQAGQDAALLDRDAIVAATGSTAYRGGWLHRSGGTVNPLALVRALARAALAAGARVHTDSPAIALRRDGSGWAIATPAGHVTAPSVLVATNALTGGLWPPLARAILPVWSFQVATSPLPEPVRARVLTSGACVSDTRRVLRYFRLDPAGRLVVGGKGTAAAPRRPAQFALQERTLQRLFPFLGGLAVTHRWGGQVAIVPGRLPSAHLLAPGLWAAIGCNGKGVAWCLAFGSRLAEAIAGGGPGALPIPLTPVAPIPFHRLRRLYVAAAAAWLRTRDRLDGAGAAGHGGRRAKA